MITESKSVRLRAKSRRHSSRVKAKKSHDLSAHYGAWKRKMDPLSYQKKVRSE